jgi:hypothetical protein
MKATRKPKRPRDPNQLVKLIVDIETGEVSRDAVADDGKNPATVRRLGGQKGGKPRAKKLSGSGGGRIAPQGQGKAVGKPKGVGSLSLPVSHVCDVARRPYRRCATDRNARNRAGVT